MLVPALLFALLQGGTPPVSPIVKIDSREQGRTFYVDTDKPDIRKALRDVSARRSSRRTRRSRTSIANRGAGARSRPTTAPAPRSLSVSPGPGATDISVNWRPKVIRPVPLGKNAHLVAVWYDDTPQILRLRDPATGKEYELGMAAMLGDARSVPLEARSADRRHQVYVNVLKRAKDTGIRLTDHYTLPRP